MLPKIKQLFTKLTAKKQSDIGVGFMLTNQAVFMAAFKRGEKTPFAFAKQEVSPDTNHLSAIHQICADTQIDAANINAIIPSNQYHLLAVDKPEVEQEDMASALRYSAKDDIPGELEQVVIDYFDIPALPFGQSKVNLVAAKRNFIAGLVEQLTSDKLAINQILIEELSYKTLFEDSEEAVLLITHQAGEELLLQIVKQGQVYFNRRIRGYNKINEFAELEIAHGVADNLSLEIQRSLDYFESQLRQAPVKRIYFAVQNANEDTLLEKVGANFPLPVLPLKNWLAEGLTAEMSDYGYIAAVAMAKSAWRQAE